MKKEFKREDLIFCIGLIREGFLQVGYQNEKDRINALAKGLLKNWKEKWPGWDKNDLKKQCQTYLEKGIGKLTVPEIVSHLSSVYKISHPSSQVQPDIDRPQVEKNYLKGIIRRIEEEDYFSADTHWRQFSLFHIPMALCREFVPEEYFEEFGRLKGELERSDYGISLKTLLRKQLGSIENRRKPKEEAELLKTVNRVTEKLIIHKAYVVGVLTATLT